MDSTGPTSNGGRLLKRGDTFDPECHRTTYRLAEARRILKAAGIEPTFAEHAETCILHPKNSYNRCHGWTYRCECGRPTEPTWTEHATGEMFDLAYRLADAEATARGDWHQNRINEERRVRELAARETDESGRWACDRDEFGTGLGEVEAV